MTPIRGWRARMPARTVAALAVALAAGLATFLPAAGAIPVAAAAQLEIVFGEGDARVQFGRVIEFEQRVDVAAPVPVTRIELLVELEGDAGPRVFQVQEGGHLERGVLAQEYDLVEDHIYPNTDVVGRFRITDDAGRVLLGPEIALTYRDDRFDWNTIDGATPAGSTVRVHWYAGNDAFGARALDIARQGIANSESRLRVTERDPIDFYIYANETDFYGALGPGTRENVGGVALAEIRTLFAQIRPSEIEDSWVETVIPHELAHLVFHTAVDNPYHDPPRWLNEGLATYESEGYGASDRRRVQAAVASDELIPLAGLAGLFPTTYEEFALAYAESVSAVEFMIRVHGSDALVDLIRSYARGITDDEAFEAALGITVAEFDAAWQADLGADPPTRFGPQPPPAGPLPSGWTRAPDGAVDPTPSAPPSAPPSVPASARATTAATPSAITTAAPTLATAASTPAASPVTVPTAGSDGGTLGLVLGAVALVLAVVGIALVLNARRTRAGP